MGFTFNWLKISPRLNSLRSFSPKNLTGRTGQARLKAESKGKYWMLDKDARSK
jgi:hypothetical protein